VRNRCQQQTITGEHFTEGEPSAHRFAAQQRPVTKQHAKDHRRHGSDPDKQHPPADKRFEHDAHRRAERHPPGHRSKQPAERPAPPLVGKQVADQRQPNRHDAAGTEPGQQTPENHLGSGLRRGRKEREHHKRQERGEQDRPTPDAVRKQTVEERRDAVSDHVGRDDQADCLIRHPEHGRQPGNQRGHHEGLKEDQKGSRR
jgi:hypothetical protein